MLIYCWLHLLQGKDIYNSSSVRGQNKNMAICETVTVLVRVSGTVPLVAGISSEILAYGKEISSKQLVRLGLDSSRKWFASNI